MLPFEIVVLGTPIVGKGAPAMARRRWQAEIRMIARSVWPENDPPVQEPLRFRLAYFFVYSQAADLDNIVKTAQDALERIVYVNDHQIIDVVASARQKEAKHRIPVTPALAIGLAGHSDFVHILVDRPSGFEVYR